MHNYHIRVFRNRKSYYLKTFGQYGSLKFAEWTDKLQDSMKFKEEDIAKEYITTHFSKRDDVTITRQFDVYGNYDYSGI